MSNIKKYLFHDDGDNIKSYNSELESYEVVGQAPVTEEMFENYGNTENTYNRKGLVTLNPSLLMYSNDDIDFKYTLQGLPSKQIVKLKNSIILTNKTVEKISIESVITGESDIKMFFYNGANYYGYKDKSFIMIDYNNILTNSYGISVREVSGITKNRYDEIFQTGRILSFLFVFEKRNPNDECFVKNVNIKYV